MLEVKQVQPGICQVHPPISYLPSRPSVPSDSTYPPLGCLAQLPDEKRRLTFAPVQGVEPFRWSVLGGWGREVGRGLNGLVREDFVWPPSLAQYNRVVQL